MTAPDRYAVVGNPVEHSRSPTIHAEFARLTGQAIEYGRLLSPLDAFTATVQSFAAGGDGLPPARGCNVTVPFKFEAFELAPRHSARAELAQAANTLRFDSAADGGWYADNTDGAGLVRDITEHAGIDLTGRRVLLLGAGGAAAGALGPLLQARPKRVVVANRTDSKAADLVERHFDLASECGVALRATSLTGCGTGFDIIINGTAASLAGASVPVPGSVLVPGALAIDMMYGPAAQGFLTWAAEHGASGRDGLGMLVEQAAESFFVWRGVRPDTKPVLAALRAALST
jgi:shikimate dehydrogenase